MHFVGFELEKSVWPLTKIFTSFIFTIKTLVTQAKWVTFYLLVYMSVCAFVCDPLTKLKTIEILNLERIFPTAISHMFPN